MLSLLQRRLNQRCSALIYLKVYKRYLASENKKELQFESQTLHHIPLNRVRNFSIIAHVDHGKSTLADRLLELTGLLTPTPTNKQVLDRLQVERERGITVKAQTASLLFSHNGENYLLNLIDTPGHVDFSNEVSRSLSACQGVILLVDANQGVEAQTVANFYLAFGQDLVIIPVLNKIDLKNADPERVCQELKMLFDIEPTEILKVSAKLGTGVKDVLKAVVERVPPPLGDRDAPLQALLFDSWYDQYRGVIGLISLKNGKVNVGDIIKLCSSGKEYLVKTLGILRPHEHPVNILMAGEVGTISCGLRDRNEAVIGDTIVHSGQKGLPEGSPLPGFTKPKPVVFAGIYPMIQSEHTALRQALEKLTLNDSAVSIIPDSSPALGSGWRLGFLGLLHMEVFCQRLEQEFGTETIVTAPSVTYKVLIHGEKNIKIYGSSEIFVSNPSQLPEPQVVQEIHEPMVLATIITPDRYFGNVISLCMERRGVQHSAINIDSTRLMIKFIMPLCEIVVDFHDKLKSMSSGFASFDYEDQGYQPSKMVKVDISLNGEVVDELSFIAHTSKSVTMGRRMCQKLLDIIPRQQFLVIIQAKIGGKIIARENLKPYRKDVTAKLYGGDVTRRIKLLKKQSEGKQRMKMMGNIALPRDTFIQALKR